LTSKKAPSENPVNERASHFLKVLVERYIQDGQPIGSRTLAKDAGLDLSPATIRNVMSDLEEMGLVASPHTSAGRIPTVSGYRMFLDSLITLKPLQSVEVESIRSNLGPLDDTEHLLLSASELLSRITNMAGVVKLPKREKASFRQIEFLHLSGNRVLAIMVTNEEEVHNRIIHTQREYSSAELEQAANYINSRFIGQGIDAIRAGLLKEMREARHHVDQIMSRALEMAGKLVETTQQSDDCMIAGQTNLMDFDELANMNRLKQLFQAFTEKQQILHLLDDCMHAEGVQIFIGGESQHPLLEGCSVVTAPYQADGRVVGVLGVIGPTRMAYERVIPIVDVTARLLGAALKHR
jgi:heat-inducible transcriptional repressor